MEWFLIRYLIVTGIGATIVINAPGLVILGFFLLIIPGLILSLLPTAFLYGLAFAVFWWPLKLVIGDWPAAALALVGAAGAMWLIPTAANRIIDGRIAADREGDKAASEPIPIKGVVRFEVARWNYEPDDAPAGRVWKETMQSEGRAGRKLDWNKRPVECDAICVAALFTPGVDAVIFAPSPSARSGWSTFPAPAQFRIDRSGACRETASIGSPGKSAVSGWNDDTLLAEWRAKISEGACIVREPATLEPDYTIAVREDYLERTNKKRRWPLIDHDRRVTRFAVSDRANTLMQRTMVETVRLSVPLWVEGSGDLQTFSFGWGRKRHSDGRQFGFFKLRELMAELTPFRMAGDGKAAAGSARRQLAALLDDPARPAADPGFALTEAVFKDIDERGPQPGDLDFVKRIIADQRMRGYWGLHGAFSKLRDDAVSLRGPIVRRLLTGPERPNDLGATLGDLLANLPERTFAEPTLDELALLADPVRRNGAPGLIKRQTDRGAEAVPLLLGMLEEIVRRRALGGKQSGPEIDHKAFDAINHALGVLGPDAAHARPRLEALLASRTERRGRVQTWGWEVTLVRMGAAAESFEKPSSRGGGETQYHESLRRDVERFERRLDEARRRKNA